MPNLNGTGPQGKGPLTGRRRGRCRDTQKTLIEKPENESAEDKGIRYGFNRRYLKNNRSKGQGGRNQGSRRGFGRNNI